MDNMYSADQWQREQNESVQEVDEELTKTQNLLNKVAGDISKVEFTLNAYKNK